MVASDNMMPLPVAVPRCSWKLSMALMRSSRLCVGNWANWALPAKATMPTRTWRGSSAMKALAASCAAVMRSGCTSVARMLPETSMASMMVWSCEGRVITASGRAAASSRATSASRKRNGGMCLRRCCAGPMASRTSDRLE